MHKFKLPKPIINPEISKIVSREVRKQKIVVTRASKKIMNEIIQVSQAIERFGLPQYLVAKKLPHGLGRGIFLHPDAKPILKRQVIAPYGGEFSISPQNLDDDSVYAFGLINNILLSKVEQQHLDPKNRFHSRRYYSLNLDAEKKGNFTRFVNHSEKPNIDAELYKIPKNTFGLAETPITVLYIANKKILPGEQLVVCYEDEDKTYWGALKIKPLHITPQTFTLSPSLKLISSLAMH